MGMRFSGHGVALFCIILICGCGPSLEAMKQVTTTELASNKRSVVLFRMGLVNPEQFSLDSLNGSLSTCINPSATIAKKNGKIYEYFTSVSLNFQVGQHDIAQVELDPGDYAIVRWLCFTDHYNLGKRIITRHILGSEEQTTFGTSRYNKSFAKFMVSTGEIVNVGSLNIITVPSPAFYPTVHIHVSDLPKDMLERFQIERPNIVSQMTTRLMIADWETLSPQKLWVVCQKMTEMNAKAGLPPPAECLTATAPDFTITDDFSRPAIVRDGLRFRP